MLWSWRERCWVVMLRWFKVAVHHAATYISHRSQGSHSKNSKQPRSSPIRSVVHDVLGAAGSSKAYLVLRPGEDPFHRTTVTPTAPVCREQKAQAANDESAPARPSQRTECGMHTGSRAKSLVDVQHLPRDLMLELISLRSSVPAPPPSHGT